MSTFVRCTVGTRLSSLAYQRQQEVAYAAHASFRYVNAGNERSISSVATPVTAASEKQPTFIELGLPEELLACLERAFPHVQMPTASQTALIQALLPLQKQGRQLDRSANVSKTSWNSVVLRDVTGSGKSLALLLALLSQPSLAAKFHKKKARQQAKLTKKIASLDQLLLVPHTELARQFESWLARLKTSFLLEDAEKYDEDAPQEGTSGLDEILSIDEGSRNPSRVNSTDGLPISDRKRSVMKKPGPFPALQQTQVLHRRSTGRLAPMTKFLITTPHCLVDILHDISIDNLHTIALDEADEMLDLPNRFATKKDEAKWLRHPPLLLSIMQELMKVTDQSSNTVKAKNSQSGSMQTGKRIVAVSASANTVFRDYLARRSGWLDYDESNGSSLVNARRQLDWYDFSSQPLPGTTTLEDSTDLSALQHTGRSLMPRTNIKHVVAKVDAKGTLTDNNMKSQETDQETPLDSERFLVATSALFALNEVRKGLLLIPSSQSLQSTLQFLQSLAVPAVPITAAFEISEADEADDPVLYVGSVDAVRGLDIPLLDWIFLPPGTRAHQDAKDYMHIAGRLGRLIDSSGARHTGTVVSLVDVGDARHLTKVGNTWKLLGIEGHALNEDSDDSYV